MKNIYKTGLNVLSIAMMTFILGCTKPDAEFVHSKNTISQMICKAIHGGGEYRGEIYEYNKAGDLMSGEFTQADIEGGYGLIIFKISKSLEKEVNLANIYLVATVTFDEFITPSLSGRHDITGDGIIITVTSGVGTTRQYRVRGEYE
jgi:hypothetical protein